MYNIHLKDKNLKNISVNLGDGIANFNELFNYCKKIKYKNFIFQTARHKNDIGIMKKILNFYKILCIKLINILMMSQKIIENLKSEKKNNSN